MRHLEIEIRSNRPLIIETPGGFITIRPCTQRRKHKHVQVDLPDGMVASSSLERAHGRAKFIGQEGEPLYDLLEPIVNEDGTVDGVRVVATARLDSEAPAAFRVVGRENNDAGLSPTA